MNARPSIGAKYRSTLTGRHVVVKDVQGKVVVLLTRDGNRENIDVRDFNAEYRASMTVRR